MITVEYGGSGLCAAEMRAPPAAAEAERLAVTQEERARGACALMVDRAVRARLAAASGAEVASLAAAADRRAAALRSCCDPTRISGSKETVLRERMRRLEVDAR
eukprot:TRINITY_DN9964_c0_g1_i1.p2 TRINITY_DN9964_c0_g1~~TRINITY_DN9964_c0_g1_i1.p2  ORF type:complete len:104 (+),score=14.96 TRINITY_DN9964_c0_g1_i1:122-433(+)